MLRTAVTSLAEGAGVVHLHLTFPPARSFTRVGELPVALARREVLLGAGRQLQDDWLLRVHGLAAPED
jgi:hypothetical protein